MSDKDRIEGVEDKIEGDLKQDVGELTGDRKLEIEGKGDEVRGDFKDAEADVRDKVDEVFHRKDNE